jgi:ring-1,2-phenylacetyl-CoA epoxidase subunit PaaE
MALNPLYQQIFVSSIVQETPDSKTYSLRTADGAELSYLPGQFLTLVFLKSGREERRSYSFSSAPALKEPLAITVKRVPNGEYSRKILDTVKEGDELITIGTGGFFTLPKEMNDIKEFVFIVAGSGITPAFSLIKTLLHTEPALKILLIYSNRTETDTIFYSSIQELAANNADRFRVEFLFSNSSELAHARLSNYWLENLLKKYAVKDVARTLFYMCGPFDYMLMVNITLLSYGVPATNIKKEHFSTFKPVPREQPPDREEHTVKLIAGDKTHEFSTHYPVSILHKAGLMGIDLPYSCEAGRCGTCVARCLEGKVWMSNNEVLLDEEIENGLILTCTGYPVGGPVIIQI